ncbi:MAG: diguanylate cyclase, partial [Alphaproteobacteria bacterium]
RDWLAQSQKNGVIRPDILQRVKDLHKDLSERASGLLEDSSRRKLPPHQEDFKKLTVTFEEFVSYLRRIEKETGSNNADIDPLTGLRGKESMEKDVKREMDRLARQGKAFSLALIQIDQFDDIQKFLSQSEQDECIKAVANFVKKSMRSFDDAYRLDKGMFILSLKQTGTQGGVKALKRVKDELDSMKISYTIEGKNRLLSLSSCIGEPAPGEDIFSFITNLTKDIKAYDGGKGSVVEFYDLSPLQRFIRDNEKNR